MDATISVVCYKSKTLSNGEHPLMLRISKDGKKKYQSLGISVNPKFWDFQKNKPKPKCPNLEYLQKIILDKKLELQKKKLEIKSDQKEYSAATLLEANANLLVAKTVDCFYKEIIAQCEINNKCGNRLVYLNSYNSLKRFTNGKLEIPFNSINVAWLEKYEKWLRSNGNKETTISLMFRTLRSTYNKAIKERCAHLSDYPFQEYKISKFDTSTQKRAIAKTDMLKFTETSQPIGQKKYVELSKDIFIFSYLCGGINFTDIANLTQENIVNGRLHYIRQKTGKLIKIGIPFTVLFEYQTTFAAFQLTDLSAEWRKYIEFHPFNFYEGWAQKILVSRQYGKGENCIEYPPLDREAITYESEKHVHLVIIGMSRMGVAIGVEAAHLLHFPNFCRDKNIKSVITFIDENADREMNFFCGRYRHYFEISSTHYYDMSKDERHERFVLPTRFKGKDADFLDVEFEFIKGRAETPAIQNLIKEWVHDSGQVLTIAVCLNYPPQSMAMGLYLPDDVYDENIPVFVRQETSSALLNMLNSKKKDEAIHKYSHVFPFGMLDNCYDLDKKSRREGQIINYIYDFKNKYGNVPQSCPPDNELKDSWNKLSVSLQWSNLYSAYSISPKLRSIGITDGYVKLDNDQITLLAEVEHNRWNMEKLLLGFRKPTAEEEELIYGSKEMGDIFKKKRFVHPDIRPYDELKESSKAYDRCITAGIPLVVNNNT